MLDEKLKKVIEDRYRFSIIDSNDEKLKNEIMIEKIRNTVNKKEKIICISSNFNTEQSLYKQLYEIKDWLNYDLYIITYIEGLFAKLFKNKEENKKTKIIYNKEIEPLTELIEICSYEDNLLSVDEILNEFKIITNNNLCSFEEYLLHKESKFTEEMKKYIYKLFNKCNFGLEKKQSIWIQKLYMDMANCNEPLEVEYKRKKAEKPTKDFKHIIINGADEISPIHYKTLKRIFNYIKSKYNDYTITLVCNSEIIHENSFITPEILKRMIENYKQIKYFKI